MTRAPLSEEENPVQPREVLAAALHNSRDDIPFKDYAYKRAVLEEADAILAASPQLQAALELDAAFQTAWNLVNELNWSGAFEVLTKNEWPDAEKWSARAYTGHGANGAVGTGSTPAAALQALADRLEGSKAK